MSALPIIRWIVHPLIGNTVVRQVSFTLLLTNLILLSTRGTAGSDIWFMDLTDRSMVPKLPSDGIMTEQSCLVKATIMLLPGVGRHPYLVSLCPSKWPCQWGESLLVAKARSLWFNVGAQNHLLTTCILVKVLAVSLYYYPLIGCFVIQGSRNTYIIELIISTHII
uniref:Secreted protein n=1 Tax=Heterorhabditis bacteriophora TaxID=37862 RepID=A0A1I7WDA6_HETBA